MVDPLVLFVLGIALLLGLAAGTLQKASVWGGTWWLLVATFFFMTWGVWNEPRNEIVGFIGMILMAAPFVIGVALLGGWLRSRYNARKVPA